MIRQRLARSYAELEILRFNTLRSLSGFDGPVAPPEASIIKLYWATWHRRLGELAIDVRGLAGMVAEGFPYELDAVPAHVPVQPVRDHLRRIQRDPEEHHRRAGPRPAARTQGGNPMTGRRRQRADSSEPPAAPAPVPPAGHGLLSGKVVVITAAAGTGIGFATAKRCVEEGATVVISDAHERRLDEAADALAELPELAGDRPLAVPCNVTDEAQVQHLYDAAVERHGRFDVAVNNAGLGGQVDVVDMTDEQWSLVLDVTLTGTFRCTRAALRHLYALGEGGVIVNNASVLGLAGSGRPVALRGGQGRGDGAHPVQRGRGGAAQRAHQRGVAEPGRPPLPQQGHGRRGAGGAEPARGLRPRGRGLGGGERHRLPGQRLRHLHDR